MSIENKLKQFFNKEGKKFNKDPDFLELQKFYRHALEKGFVKKAEYTLPPIDTVGHDLAKYMNQKTQNH